MLRIGHLGGCRQRADGEKREQRCRRRRNRCHSRIGAFQLKFVAQHSKHRCVAVDIDGPLLMVDLDRVGHHALRI